MAKLDMTSIIEQIYEELPRTIHSGKKKCNEHHKAKMVSILGLQFRGGDRQQTSTSKLRESVHDEDVQRIERTH